MGRAFEYRKARKMKRWGAMSKAFTKIGKEISIAVKSGGPDPESNARLRIAVQNAKDANMPKDNVERAIKKASSKDEADLNEVVFEGYGPHGIAFVLDCLTDNNTRTVANVRSYFSKCGGSLGVSGSTDFMFERKCVFKVEPKEDTDIEELELELIDVGVDEVDMDEDENKIIVSGEFTSFGEIQKYFEGNGFEIKAAGLERFPLDTKTVSEEQEADLEKLIEKFEEDEDVQNIFHNMG